MSSLLAGAIFIAALLSSAPAWHELLHSDKPANHVCLVTFSVAGQCEASAAPPVMVAPSHSLVFGIPRAADTFSLPPNRDFSLLEHAPPSFA